jgi:hypothetical protein
MANDLLQVVSKKPKILNGDLQIEIKLDNWGGETLAMQSERCVEDCLKIGR